jgi:hypothetical protein
LTLASIMEPSIHTSKGNYVLDKWFNLIPCYGMSTPTLFQQQVINASLASRWPNAGFHAWATRALKQTEMETCCVLVAAQRSFPPIGNHVPQNMSLKQEPQNLRHIETCQVSARGSACILMLRQPKPPKYIAHKHLMKTMF